MFITITPGYFENGATLISLLHVAWDISVVSREAWLIHSGYGKG